MGTDFGRGSTGGNALGRRVRQGLVAFMAMALMVPAIFMETQGAGGTVTPAAVSSTKNPFGFPDWYQDTTGVRLEPCLDVTDPNCIVLPNPGVFDPALPMDIPDNFPDEFFYQVADSDKMATPGCSGTRPGRAYLRSAVEGAFVNGLPADNEQMVFGRVRVVVTSGLCPNTDYTFTHPYGTITLHTNELGGVPRNQGTVDVGCAPLALETCDFSQALASPAVQSFLRWDPNVAPAAPAGYLGDAATLHAVTGATYEPNGPGNGFANYFKVEPSAGGDALQTDQFTVMGREAGPVIANTTLVDFAGQHINTTSTVRTVNLTNIGRNPVTLGTITASPAGRFTASDPGACAGRTLARDQFCQVRVTFSPVVVGQLAGTLTVNHNGDHSPFRVALAGTGTNPGQEAILSTDVGSLNLGSARIRTQSLAQRIRVTNTGNAPLVISAINRVDTTTFGDAQQFVITSDKCTGVALQAGKRCDVNVAFRPTGTGPVNAKLQFIANVSGGPVDVLVSGQGSGGVAAVSAAIDEATGFPQWYQDEQGVRISECIDPADPNCIVLGDDFFDPAQPLSGRPAFSNFPSEYFYTVADSDIITTPGCGGAAGRAFVRSAQEAAFVDTPADGGQMVFGRNRIVVRGGLCPGAQYTFTTPYGQSVLTADARGRIQPNAGTVDIGCVPVPGVTPCNFADALSSPVSAGYLQWDPAVAPAAPAGYLGDAATLHRITGSPYIAPGDTTPANYFKVVGPVTPGGPNVTIGQTNLFTVMGKLNGPITANPSNVSFPPYQVGSQGNEQVTLTNEGTTAITLTSLVLGGTNPGDFVIDGGCDGGHAVLAAGASCNFNVQFQPTATGSRTGTIQVNHTGRNTGFKVPLDGIGQAAGDQPGISVSPDSLPFVDLHVGQSSASKSVTVSNLGGQAPLEVGTPTISGSQFVIFDNGCTDPVAVDDTCTIKVRFTPSTGGGALGVLNIPSNVPGTPLVTVPLSGRGFTGAPAVSPGTRASDGFPDWYQDDNGVRLQPCLDPADPNCIVLGDDFFDPAQPLDFPSNFPGEFFYTVADSDQITTSGCNGATAPGPAFLRVAVEGSFANGAPEAGAQTTFGRVRVVVRSGLCPNTSYTFTTPYGVVGPFLTNSLGGVPANVGTSDIDPPTASPLLTDGVIRWDPSASPAAPNGYLGDALTLHKVVGSRFVPAGEVEPANYFSINGPDSVGGPDSELGRTNLFTVSGKLAGPITSTPPSNEFGNVDSGTTSPNLTVTLTNVSPDNVTGFASTLTGPNASDFQVTGGTCTGATIGLDQSCTVTVRFAPALATTPGPKSATLSVAHSGLNSPATVALTGTAVVVPVAAVTLSPTSVAFASRDLGTTSAPVTVNVTNSGTGPLSVSSASLVGTTPDQFHLTNNCTASVAPGASCTVSVTFQPTSGGAKSAQIRLVDNAPTSPQTVALTGTGVSASLNLSPTSLAFGSVGVGGSSSKPVRIDNTGTAPLSILSLTLTGSPVFTIASHNCGAAIAPGRNCSVNIRFAPNARVAFTGQLNIGSNAIGSPHAVPLTGTGK